MAKNARGWTFINLDDGTKLEGQFEATDVNVSRGAAYAEIQALGRQHPILQFLHGDINDVTFNARLFATSSLDLSALAELTLLRKWSERDEILQRPPTLSFSIGDGHISVDQCVLVSVREQHDRVGVDGQFKGAVLGLHLQRYLPFKLEGGVAPESRYHHVKRRDYYEMLALHEYNDPNAGDIIRARYPDKPILLPGHIVKLPSPRAIATQKSGLRSTALKNAFARQDTPQRTRLREALAARSSNAVSHVLKG